MTTPGDGGNDLFNGIASVGISPGPGLPTGEASGRVETSIVRGFGGSNPTPSEWNDLVARCDGPVYTTYEWQSLWWECFGTGRELHIVRFFTNGKVVGIAPFFRERGNTPGKGRLRFIGAGDAFTKSGGMFHDDGPGDYLDVLVDPEYRTEVGESFLAFLLNARGSVERIDLVNLREDGCFMTMLAPRLAGTPFAPEFLDSDRCPYIPVDQDTEGFIRGLDAGARRRYGQAFRLAAAPEAPLRRISNDPGFWNTFFDDMVRLHQERWNRAGFPGLFFDGKQARFQRLVADAFARNGWLWFTGLYDGNECLAARLGFVFRGRLYDYLSGFNETSPHARKRPGLGLLIAMYHDARARGLERLDLLRGEESYKFELTDRAIRIRNATIHISIPAGPSDRLVGSILSVIEKCGFLLAREARLCAVQTRRNGVVRGIARYAEFRSARLRNKLKTTTMTTVKPPSKGDTAE